MPKHFTSSPAPILLFVYNRLDSLQTTIGSLKKNIGATESQLFVFSDGPKSDLDKQDVDAVRHYIKTITGFSSVEIIESINNLGLANSIIQGVSLMFERYEKLIVLEDDLETSTTFLQFMNESLEYYQDNNRIISIAGYNMAITPRPDYPYDIFFSMRSASWGWATWRDKWLGIDWNVTDFNQFKRDKLQIKKFNEMGSDMFNMLHKQQLKKNNSWAIRYCYHQFKHDLYTVFPVSSKVRNIGFNEKATHTVQKYNRFDVELDKSNTTSFKFSRDIILDPHISKQFRGLNGLRARLYSKFLNTVYKFLS